MGVQDRGDRWEVVISLGVDPVTGERRRQSRTFSKSTHSRRDAEKELTAMRYKADRTEITPTSGTVGQLVDAWLELKGSTLSPTTLRRYQQIHRDYIAPRWGTTRMTDVKVMDLDLWYQALSRGSGDERGPLSPSSVRQVHSVLRAAFRQGRRWGYVASNPMHDVTLPRLDDSQVSPPSVAEIRAVLAGMENDDTMAMLVLLAAATGMRRSELCGLRWRDVDLERCELRVRHVIVQTGRELHEKTPKTKSSMRTISVDPPVIEQLVAYRVVVEHRAAVSAVKVSPAAFVFSRDATGERPMIPDSVTQSWLRHAKKAHVDARLHDLRHANATEMIAEGIDIRTVANRLGHAQTSTTLNIYAHAMKARDQEAAAVMGSKLLG